MCKLEMKNKWLLLKNWTIPIFGTFVHCIVIFATTTNSNKNILQLDKYWVKEGAANNNQKQSNQKGTKSQKKTNCNLILLLRRFAKEKSSLLFISHLKTGLNVGEIWHQSRRSSGIIWNNLMKCIGNTYYEIHYILDPWSIRNFVEADRDRVKENQEKTKYHW